MTMTIFQTRGNPGAYEPPHSPRLGSPDILEPAHCPQCGKDAKEYRRRGSRLICVACWRSERAKDAACTCETYGRCEVCR